MAADVAMAGMDPMRFLETEDPVESVTMLAIAKRWYDRARELHTSQAIEIVKKLGEGMKAS